METGKQEWRPLPQRDKHFFFFNLSCLDVAEKLRLGDPTDLPLTSERTWDSNKDSVKDVGGSLLMETPKVHIWASGCAS